MLAPQKRQAETATAHRQDKDTEDSSLAVAARGLQDGEERALGFHARYMGLDSGGSITINREFDEVSMQSDMLTAWTRAVADAGVPERFMLKDMQGGGLIASEEDVEDIADEMQANRDAAQQQKDAAAQDIATNAATGATAAANATKPSKSKQVDVEYPDGRKVKLTLSSAA